MPSLWGKSSYSKEVMDEKQKTTKGRFLNLVHQKLKHLGRKKSGNSGVSQRCLLDTCSKKVFNLSASALPSLQVSRCQSFMEEPHAQPLPLPVLQSAVPSSLDVQGSSKYSVNSPFSGHEYGLTQPLPPDVWGDLAKASVSSDSSIDTNDEPDSQASDYDSANITATNSPSRHMDHASILSRRILEDQLKLVNPPCGNHMPLASIRNGPFGSQVTKLQIAPRAGYFSTPGSYISSPQSPVNACTQRRVRFCPGAGRLCSDMNLDASGHSSCSGSGVISGHNPGGDLSSISPQNKYSPDHSPIPSLLHPWPKRFCTEVSMDSPDDGKPEGHKLPLPPMTLTCSCPFPHSCSAVNLPNPPSNLGRPEISISPSPGWKKGSLVGSGTFGHVYLAFNSDTGDICAIKEVTLFSDDEKSQECAQQLGQEITLLSCLRHPNIVRYFGSEMIDNKLSIYLEYVSGGSINKLLQVYGKFDESVIRIYTRQILSGLAYLHSKNTVHRDIKGANVLVCPSGQVKLADFGMAKHIADSCPLSFKGSPYWMAPEIVKKSCGSNFAVDIWSLGCTVIEMATTKPPWSQYEGVAALFKIGNSKEVPEIPNHLSDEGKDFVWKCLQQNPLHRPTAVQLLDHPFVRVSALPEICRKILERLERHSIDTDAARNEGSGQGKTISSLNLEGVATQLRDSKHVSGSSNPRKPKHLSCPVSPIGSPRLNSKSSQPMYRRMSHISSSQIVYGSSMTCTSGNVAFQVNHFHNSMSYSPEGMGARRPQKSVYTCGTPLYGKPLSRIPEISQEKKN